jgi:triosephosphate isomerase
VGGNWKMNTNLASARKLAEAVGASCAPAASHVDVVVFPPFPYMIQVGEALRSTRIAMGAQDAYFEADGAFTGEVSCAMVKDAGAKWVLAGHSERRHVLGETDDLINRKVRAALAAGLSVILCIGETIEQRDSGKAETVTVNQLQAGLKGVSRGELDQVVIAYEPVWAIGTGRTATPADAQTMHSRIRSALSVAYDGGSAQGMRIQYGGSVKPENAAELFSQPDIDGGLIGGASLKAETFGSIVQAAATAAAPAKAIRT